jgi:hypothetical protein
MDPQGDTTIAWTLNNSLRPVEELLPIQVATRTARSDFSEPAGINVNRVYHPTVAMNSRGETAVAWVTYNEEHAYIQTWRRRAVSENFETSNYISEQFLGEAASEIQPKMSMDEAGSTIVAWEYGGRLDTVTTQSAGPIFGQPTEIQDSNPSIGPVSLVMNNHGDAVMTWAGMSENGSYAAGSTKSAMGAFGAPATLSEFSDLLPPEGEEPPVAVAMDAHRDAAAAWVSSDGTHNTLQVAGYQGGGPQLEALQIPGEGQTGTTLTFSVSPLSVWSPSTSTTWSWGDGSPSASGTEVTHVFRAPGTYTVTVSASNALSNVTIATRTLTIRAARNTGKVPTNEIQVTENPIAADRSTLLSHQHKGTPRAVVPAFTPLFATRAWDGGHMLGLLVEIVAIRGAVNDETLVVRCIASCAHSLHETAHIQRHHNARGKLPITPPLKLRQSTRIEIDLKAPHHITRFVQYRFVRTHLGVIAHITHKGCLSPTNRPAPCS